MNKQHILDEIKRTAAANGGVPPGRERFFGETGIKPHDWLGKFWARWGDAIREAGFEPNELQTAYNENLLIEKFIAFARHLGHFPVNAELRLEARSDEDFPSHNTFTRFGSKQQLAATILDYCKGRTGYQDVIDLCAPIATRPRGNGKNQIDSDEVIGFVYLMKSGGHYKIGRSNPTGRRQYELAIQMPEKIITVHTIKTDDPVGIEEYWHRRFIDKRKNGE